MALHACVPVSTSVSATPTLTGGPSSSPVIDINPPTARARVDASLQVCSSRACVR
jgi:hypothetical protein